jgi:anaerobic magnesium-protoporphyrin IX monomethyl ester cyclase
MENNKARITLIRPPILELKYSLSYYGACLPIGLAYIAAVLRDNGHKVTVIDAIGEEVDCYREIVTPVGSLYVNGLSPDEIVDRIPLDTEIIGITHMFLHEWPIVRQIAETAKAKFSNIPIMLGGENATAFWEYILKESTAVDYCVIGEGEKKVVELVDYIKNGKSEVAIAGVVGLKQISGNYRHECNATRISEIDKLPWPAWEYFAVENYLAKRDQHGVYRGRSMPMLATRGCPFQCTFCSSHQMWGTRYIARQPQDVVKEIKFYVERYKINNINFCDLTLLTERKWVVEFCKLIEAANINITWQLPTGTRSEVLDDEVLSLLYRAGCRNITYAPESGSERMFKILKKKVNLQRMLNSLKIAHKLSFITRVNIIIGHPEEHLIDTWNSLKLLVKSALVGCSDAAVMIFAPYPGTDDFRKLLEKDKVVIDKEYYYLALARSGRSSKTYNARMGTRQLIFIQFFMLFIFYGLSYSIHPLRIFYLMRSIISGYEQTQVEQLFSAKLRRNKKVCSKLKKSYGE